MNERVIGHRLLLAGIGGGCYLLLELVWRGYTHWSMFVVGGLCFSGMGRIGRICRRRPLLIRCLLCSLTVTAAELISGLLLNRVLKLQVWDYSHLPLNLWGQICLLFSVLWGLLSIPGMKLYAWLDRECQRNRQPTQPF